MVKGKPITPKKARGVLRLEIEWIKTFKEEPVEELEKLLMYLESDEAKAEREKQKTELLKNW